VPFDVRARDLAVDRQPIVICVCLRGRGAMRRFLRPPGAVRRIAICYKWKQRLLRFFAKFDSYRREVSDMCTEERRGEEKVRKIVPFIVAASLGAGFVGAAQAHVSVGIGIGVPAYPAYPVYAAPGPVYLAPPPPPVVYQPPVVYAPPPVVVGGYYGQPYWNRGYYGHGYYGRGYYGHGRGHWH
jgi:hypothetical protein